MTNQNEQECIIQQSVFPLLGKVEAEKEIYTFSGLGSKGFLFAPLCSEILAALMLYEACPVPASLLQKLNLLWLI